MVEDALLGLLERVGAESVLIDFDTNLPSRRKTRSPWRERVHASSE